MITWPSTLRAARPIVWISDVSRAQEALLVGVEDRDERHLGQVETLPQQVDADEHVELAEPQRAQDLDPLERVDLAVQVAHADAELEQVVGEVLGHLLGERGDEHPLVALDARPLISATRSSIWPLVGRTITSGSMRPVGRTICSTTCVDISSSYGLGVADMNTTWFTCSMNSSNRSGRLSIADGSRKPCSTSVSLRDRSPSYWPCSCGTVDVRLVEHARGSRRGSSRAACTAAGPAPGRRGAASSSRCPSTSRPRAASRGRRWCACAAAAPRAACPAARAQRAAPSARPRCPRSPRCMRSSSVT